MSWQQVRLTNDRSRFLVEQQNRHGKLDPQTWEKIVGQVVRVRFYKKDDDGHTYWDVHPEDVQRLTPEYNAPTHRALVCSCIVECD